MSKTGKEKTGLIGWGGGEKPEEERMLEQKLGARAEFPKGGGKAEKELGSNDGRWVKRSGKRIPFVD